jgi:hypothetical protein
MLSTLDCSDHLGKNGPKEYSHNCHREMSQRHQMTSSTNSEDEDTIHNDHAPDSRSSLSAHHLCNWNADYFSSRPSIRINQRALPRGEVLRSQGPMGSLMEEIEE